MYLVFFLHFIADWVIQGPKAGREKSENIFTLFKHILEIFSIISLSVFFFEDWVAALVASFLNAIVHLLIDGSIWQVYKVTVWCRNRDKCPKKLAAEWKYWVDPVFGWFLGFDQMLHFATLYLLFRNIV